MYSLELIKKSFPTDTPVSQQNSTQPGSVCNSLKYYSNYITYYSQMKVKEAGPNSSVPSRGSKQTSNRTPADAHMRKRQVCGLRFVIEGLFKREISPTPRRNRAIRLRLFYFQSGCGQFWRRRKPGNGFNLAFHVTGGIQTVLQLTHRPFNKSSLDAKSKPCRAA